MTPDPKFFRCSCSCEVLSLEWLDADKKELCVSIYEHPKKSTWRWRIKQAWRVLRRGTPYGDQLIFQTDTLKELSSFFEAYGRGERRRREKEEQSIDRIKRVAKRLFENRQPKP